MTFKNQNSSRLAAERKENKKDVSIDPIVTSLAAVKQANLNIYVNVGGAA